MNGRAFKMTDMTKKTFRRICFICNRYESDYLHIEMHHIFEGRGRRQISDRYGLIVPLCRDCHDRAHTDAELAQMLHEVGQKKAEADGMTREQFIYLFGRNYLE